MKTTSLQALLALLSLALPAGARAESGPPAFGSRLIFPAQPNHVHSSSIVECPNGDFLVVWFHGSGERTANDVVIQGARLKRGAEGWGEVFVAADTPGLPDCNPVVFLDGRQRLWLAWVVVRVNRWEQSLLKYKLSTDYEGSGPPRWQWQDVILIQPGEDFPDRLRQGFKELGYEQAMWGAYAKPYDELLVEAAADPVKRDIGWMTRARPLRIAEGARAGRLLLPLYSDGFNLSLMAISDDDGERWRPSKPMVGLGNIQPTLARRKDGSIVAFMRDGGEPPNRVLVSESRDDGETWSVARDTDLPNPSSSLALVTLADGRWLMVLNDTEDSRHQLAIVVSDDEGRTWKGKRYLEKSPRGQGGYAYPTAIQARDGRVHVTYTYNGKEGKSIKHVDFDPKWLAQ